MPSYPISGDDLLCLSEVASHELGHLFIHTVSFIKNNLLQVSRELVPGGDAYPETHRRIYEGRGYDILGNFVFSIFNVGWKRTDGAVNSAPLHCHINLLSGQPYRCCPQSRNPRQYRTRGAPDAQPLQLCQLGYRLTSDDLVLA